MSLTKLRYGEDNYVFVMDLTGKILADKDINRIGKTDTPLLELFVDTLKNNPGGQEGYVRFDRLDVPESINSPDKLNYIRMVWPWGWILGTSIFTSDIEKLIIPQVAELEKQNKQQLYRILIILFAFSAVLLMLSVAASRYIKQRFILYRARLNSNILALEESQEQLRKLATTDSLTSIPNRTALEENLTSGLKHSARSSDSYAVIFVDLDDFKRINDAHGHHVGDELLKAVGEKFQALCNEQDVLARFGGDEFVFGYQVNSKQEASEKALAIRRVFYEPFLLSRVTIMTSCSIGVSMSPDNGSDVASLLSKSDIALYRSKEVSKGQILFYDHNIDEEVRHQLHVENNLRNAMKKDEISVFYQPKIGAESNTILGVEALCRWHSENLGPVRLMNLSLSRKKRA